MCALVEVSMNMRTFHVDCELNYDLWEPAVFIFNIAVPFAHEEHVLIENLVVSADATIDGFVDQATGNRFTRVSSPGTTLNVRYLATIEVPPRAVDENAPEVHVSALPGACVPFLHASRYCESDLLFNEAVATFGHSPRGYARVQTICQWIRDNIAYSVGTSSPLTTARDALLNRAGVCRDYAHLAIAFCRALNIPARFVTGYARYSDPPPDFHAVFEAFLGDRWYLFDPTLLSPLDEIVRIGTGRDASDVAFATFYGTARMRKLSPLLDLARPDNSSEIVELQRPDSGILLTA
jgi:transglutaminase-like putative cysteine protease